MPLSQTPWPMRVSGSLLLLGEALPYPLISTASSSTGLSDSQGELCPQGPSRLPLPLPPPP